MPALKDLPATIAKLATEPPSKRAYAMSFRPTNNQALRICSLAQDTGSTLAETLEALVNQALSEARVVPWDLHLEAGLQSRVEQVSGTVGVSPGELVSQFLDQRRADLVAWLTTRKDKAVRQRNTAL